MPKIMVWLRNHVIHTLELHTITALPLQRANVIIRQIISMLVDTMAREYWLLLLRYVVDLLKYKYMSATDIALRVPMHMSLTLSVGL